VAAGTAEPYVRPSCRAAAVLIVHYFVRSAILNVREVTGITRTVQKVCSYSGVYGQRPNTIPPRGDSSTCHSVGIPTSGSASSLHDSAICNFMVTWDSTLFHHVLHLIQRLRAHQTRHNPNYPSFNSRVPKRGRSLLTASPPINAIVDRTSPRECRSFLAATNLGRRIQMHIFLWYSFVRAKAPQDQSRFCPRNFGLYALLRRRTRCCARCGDGESNVI
jgi:hypothetical protein